MKIDTVHAPQPSSLLDLFRQNRMTPESAPPLRRDAVDRVEVSGPARWMDKLQELRHARETLVNRVRAEIAAGAYDVEGRLDTALDRMIEDRSSNRFAR